MIIATVLSPLVVDDKPRELENRFFNIDARLIRLERDTERLTRVNINQDEELKKLDNEVNTIHLEVFK